MCRGKIGQYLLHNVPYYLGRGYNEEKVFMLANILKRTGRDYLRRKFYSGEVQSIFLCGSYRGNEFFFIGPKGYVQTFLCEKVC
jgi:hypothetical protein